MARGNADVCCWGIGRGSGEVGPTIDIGFLRLRESMACP